MTLPETALSIALEAHQGQVDRAGKPYIDHVTRVAAKQTGESAVTAAFLHDVLEDTALSAAYLRTRGIPEEVVTAVVALTRKAGESYMDFIARAAQNPIAKQVKIADLIGNMNLGRLITVTYEDAKRIRKYAEALMALLGAMDERHHESYPS